MEQDTTIQSLTKLAQELTDRVDELQQANDSLKQQIADKEATVKQASEQTVVRHASEELVDKTLDSLIKLGALNEDQRAESRVHLLEDPDAPYRILQKFIDVQSQVKQAAQDTDNVSGGQLVNQTASTKQDSDSEVYDRMMQILHM